MSAFRDYFIDTLKNKYADFSGRASRSEYWYFGLFFSLILMTLSFLFFICIDLGINTKGHYPDELYKIGVPLLIILSLIIIVPAIAINVRRLHDIGRSGLWYIPISLIPFGHLLFLIACCIKSQPGRNEWGPNPWEAQKEK